MKSKFSIGEVVKVRGVNISTYDCDRATVTGVEYMQNGICYTPCGDAFHHTGFMYDLECGLAKDNFFEASLIKLKDDHFEVGSWDDCIFKPKKFYIKGILNE